MSAIVEHTPWLVAMGALVLLSSFCSASEAALFFLDRRARRQLAAGNRAQRAAAGLLADTDRLLTAILFWNLLANTAIFTISSILTLRLQREGYHGQAGVLAAVSLVGTILLGEMLPKTLGVAQPRAMATLVSLPLATLVRLADPLLPILRGASVLSRRVLWPGFKEEPYLAIGDLERAVRISTSSEALLEQEEQVLQGIVLLSTMRVDELMRPRTQVTSFPPPVSLANLGGQVTPSGYLLITEKESEELAAALSLLEMWSLPQEHLEEHARELQFVPWCTTMAQAAETMLHGGHRVLGVVNEHGETIGVLTHDDLLEFLFSRTAGQSEGPMRRGAIRMVAPGVWHVSGLAGLGRIARYFGLSSLPETRGVTLAGVVQEALERLPQPGDVCIWGPFRLRVLEAAPRGRLLVELERQDQNGDAGP